MLAATSQSNINRPHPTARMNAGFSHLLQRMSSESFSGNSIERTCGATYLHVTRSYLRCDRVVGLARATFAHTRTTILSESKIELVW